MTINAEFNNYDEMLSFCKSIVGKETPSPAAAPDPEPVPQKKPEPLPFVEEEKPEPEPEPVKEEKPPIKKEDVRRLLAAKKKEGKDVSAVIRSFGVEMFKEIPEEQYAELLEKVEAL